MTTAEDLIQETIEAHRFDNDGESLVKGLVRVYLAQSKNGQVELLETYREWIRRGDPIRADWAIAIIRQLDLVDELETIECALQKIRDGTSSLPTYFDQFLVQAIEELKSEKRR